ncbi:MAG: hypothetical protein K2M22_01990, partial [Lachnospiraceae bacterium]|nr:hypothetical protein [Lachnospiraceae bacterium]
LMYVLPVSRLVLLVAIAVGMCVYGAILLLIGGVTEDELWDFPKGELLVQIAKKLHLLPDWEAPINGNEKKRKRKKRKKKK